ncbi:tRNA (guanine(9)-N(1))-methyltransferase [Varicellaria rhodocarpa]|nr:tRNA (guanine(9)-N(1))-methyltransferase [Varicellaria rhodocarpa]
MEADERPFKKRRVSGSFEDDYKDPQTLPKENDLPSQQAFELVSNPKPSDEVTGTSPVQNVLENISEIHTDGPLQETDQEEVTQLDSDKPQLSKKQTKRLRREEEWQANGAARKAKRKQKIKEKKERKREAQKETKENTLVTSPDSHNLVKVDEPTISRDTHHRSKQLPITFVLDCGFDDVMVEKERISLASQLTRSYSENHRAHLKSHLVVSSFGGHLKERFETVLSRNHENWKNVRFLDGDFVEAAEQAKTWMAGDLGGELAGAFDTDANREKEVGESEEKSGEVIYLSSESPNSLAELKPYSTYIIGGLVDRNRLKGICYKRAMDRGIKTAKLPIGDYMQMTSRFVLATNHVVEIMLKWLELRDWGEAFLSVIPKRKGGTLKRQEGQKTTPELEGGDTVEQEGEEDIEDTDGGSGGVMKPLDSEALSSTMPESQHS